MADENRGHNRSENPDPQKDGLLRDDITHPQDPQTLPDRLPKSLVEWLARIKRHLLENRFTIKLNWYLSPACKRRYLVTTE